ncbi:hypothetical protein CYMTET_29149, partial [Cymbomonas tetramitiformis]
VRITPQGPQLDLVRITPQGPQLDLVRITPQGPQLDLVRITPQSPQLDLVRIMPHIASWVAAAALKCSRGCRGPGPDSREASGPEASGPRREATQWNSGRLTGGRGNAARGAVVADGHSQGGVFPTLPLRNRCFCRGRPPRSTPRQL